MIDPSEHQQGSLPAANAEGALKRSQSSPDYSASIPRNEANRMGSNVQSGAAGASSNKQATHKTLTDSGVESSVQTTSYNGEARRLLDSGATPASAHFHSLLHNNNNNNSNNNTNSYNNNHQHNQHRNPFDEQQFQQQQQPDFVDNMSLKVQSLRLFPAYFAAELMSTFLLVLIGDGALAAYVFSRKPVDAFAVCLAFGVGAMIASYVSLKISGAHMNPAATLALALDNKLRWALVPVYILAQYIGGFLAALVLYLNYYEAIKALDGGNHTAYGSANSTGGVFATYPAPFVTVWGSLLDQIVGTAVLLFSLTAVCDKLNLGLEERFQPPIVALAIGLVCFAFSVNCGAIFNPARDLAPRLLTFLLGYPAVWAPIDGTYWIVAGVVGPHVGAIVGVFSYKYLIGSALRASQNHLQMVRYVSAQGLPEIGFVQKKTASPAKPQTPEHRRLEVADYGSASKR